MLLKAEINRDVGTRRAASSYQAMCSAFDYAARRVPTRRVKH